MTYIKKKKTETNFVGLNVFHSMEFLYLFTKLNSISLRIWLQMIMIRKLIVIVPIRLGVCLLPFNVFQRLFLLRCLHTILRMDTAGIKLSIPSYH